MGSSINLALPAISKELSINAIVLGWVVTAYNLSAAMFLLPLGRIADIKGRERVFKAGMIIYALFSVASALAPTGATLIASRFLQGIGGAMIFGTSTAILTSSFPVQERGKALGINISAVYLGSSLGPVIGGVLTNAFGWRSIFAANGAISAVVIVLSLVQMKNVSTGQERAKFDLPGSLIYGLSLTLLMLGFSSLPSAHGAIFLLAGAAGIVSFGVIMNKTASPLLDLKVFKRNTVFVFSNLAALINYSATFAIGFLISLYLQFVKGFSPRHAGLILVVQPVIMTIFTSIAGRLSDSIEPRLLASAGMALTTVGLGIFIFLDASTPISFVIICLAFIGLGFALFSSPNTNATMSSVDKRHYGVASAMLGTMRLLGMMFSMGVIMMILSMIMGKTMITPEQYGVFMRSARIAFAVFTALCFAGIFASLARGNVRSSQGAPALNQALR
jgi:MFS family permease